MAAKIACMCRYAEPVAFNEIQFSSFNEIINAEYFFFGGGWILKYGVDNRTGEMCPCLQSEEMTGCFILSQQC